MALLRDDPNSRRILRALDDLIAALETGSVDTSPVELKVRIARILRQLTTRSTTPPAGETAEPENSPSRTQRPIAHVSLGKVRVVFDRSEALWATAESLDAGTSKDTGAGSFCISRHLSRRLRCLDYSSQNYESLHEYSAGLLTANSYCAYSDGIYGRMLMRRRFAGAPEDADLLEAIIEKYFSASSEQVLRAIPRDLSRLLRLESDLGTGLPQKVCDVVSDYAPDEAKGSSQILLRAARRWTSTVTVSTSAAPDDFASIDENEAMARGIEARLSPGEPSDCRKAFLQAYSALLGPSEKGTLERLGSAAAFLAGSASADAMTYLFELAAIAEATFAGIASEKVESPVGTLQKAIRVSGGVEACFARSASGDYHDERLEPIPGRADRHSDHRLLVARALSGDIDSARKLLGAHGPARMHPRNERIARLLLTSSQPEVRRLSASRLKAAAPDRALAYAVYLLGAANPAYQIAAVSIIELYDLQTARPLLLKALSSKDPWVVRAAVGAAGRTGQGSRDESLAGAVLAARARCAGGLDVCAAAVVSIGAPEALSALASLRAGTIRALSNSKRMGPK